MRQAGEHERLPYVDGLRAVAVLAVVAYHAWQYTGDGGGPFVARIFTMGAHGVDLFFVLSGFCLAYPYLKRLRSSGSAHFSVAAFAAKRLTRILPPYWIALLSIVALGLAKIFTPPPPLPDIITQLLLFDRDVHYVARPFWTLPVEMRWYFVFPLALILYVRAPRCALAVALSSYVLYDFARMNGTFDFGTLPAFFAGIWVADVSLKPIALSRFALPLCIFFGALAITLEPDDKHAFYACEPLGVIATLALVVFAGRTTMLRMLLAHPALTTIGAASYGIYLIHDPILARLQTVDHVGPWLAGMTAIGVSMVFSLLCERPFIAGPLRDAIVVMLTGRCAQLIAWLGVPAVLTLRALPIAPVGWVGEAPPVVEADRRRPVRSNESAAS